MTIHNQIGAYIHELETLAGEVQSLIDDHANKGDKERQSLVFVRLHRCQTLLQRIGEARAEIAQSAGRKP